MRQRTESAKNEVCFMSVTTATVVVGSTLFAYQLTSNISPISTSAEVVVAKTSVEESPVAEMLVSRVAFLRFIIVVSVRATTAPTSGTAPAEGSYAKPLLSTMRNGEIAHSSSGIPKKSLVSLKRTWDQTLVSGVMLLTCLTIHLFQFRFADTEHYRHPSYLITLTIFRTVNEHVPV